MPSDPAYYRSRWEMAKVDFELSYGMSDQDQLVGFIIHAVDQRQGKMTAFNTGTVVLPEYRGRRIVKAIYDYALPDLQKNGIEKTILEVMQENEIAIKLYKGVGFQITKDYRCFGGSISSNNQDQVLLKQVNIKQIDWQQLPNQEMYSWDNHHASVSGGDYQCFKVYFQGTAESFFAINPAHTYLAQLEVLIDDPAAWSRLFAAIARLNPQVRINNVDARLQEKINQLSLHGLKNTINQFEMEMDV